MICHIVSLLLLGQTSFVPDAAVPELTVILREQPSIEDSKLLRSMSNQKREEFFLEKHFFKVAKGVHTYLFPSEVWGEVELKAKTEAMQQILASIDTHGEIRAFTSPALMSILGEQMASSKLDAGPETVLVVSHETTCMVYKNGHAVEIPLLRPRQSENLSAHPFLQSQDSISQPKIPHDQSFGTFFLYDSGPEFDSYAARDRDLAGAMLILAEHSQALEEKFHQAKTALMKKLTGDDLKNLVRVPPQDIGAWTLGELRQDLKHSWKNYGFTDAQSAQDFLVDCQISTFNHLYVTGSASQTLEYSYQFD